MGAKRFVLNLTTVTSLVDKQLAEHLLKRFPESVHITAWVNHFVSDCLCLGLRLFMTADEAVLYVGYGQILLEDQILYVESWGWKRDEKIECKSFEDIPLSFDKILARLDRAHTKKLLTRKRALRSIGAEYRRLAGPAQAGDLSIAVPPAPLLIEDKQKEPVCPHMYGEPCPGYPHCPGAKKPLKNSIRELVFDLTGVEAAANIPNIDEINEIFAKRQFPACTHVCDGTILHCECLYQKHLADKDAIAVEVAEKEIAASGIKTYSMNPTCRRYKICQEEPGFCNCLIGE